MLPSPTGLTPTATSRPRSTPAAKKKPPTTGKAGAIKGSGGADAKSSSGSTSAKDCELRRLRAEAAVAAAALLQQQAATRAAREELERLRAAHAADIATAADVLQAQQAEKQRLKEEAWQLDAAAAAAHKEAATAQATLRFHLDAAAAAAAVAEQQEAEDASAGQDSDEVRHLLSSARRQGGRLAEVEREAAALRARLAAAERELEASATQCAALRVKAASASQLRFVRSEPFLVHITRQLIRGAAPRGPLQPGSTLAAAGRRLVLESGAGTAPAFHSLQLDTGTWTAASDGSDGGAAGRAVCAIGGKRLLAFGGTGADGEVTGGTLLLSPDLPHWLPAPPPAEPLAVQPPARAAAALAFCPAANAAFLFGGRDASDALLCDLWRLDVASSQWRRLDGAGSSGGGSSPGGGPAPAEVGKGPGVHSAAPPPCAGAALAVSPDGSRLWLMGGRLEGGRCSSALHWWDLAGSYWAAAEMSSESSPVEPREQHAIACIGRHVVVCGGLAHTTKGQTLHRQDTCIYDTAVFAWEGRPASAVVMLAEQGRRRSSCSTASRGSVSSAAEAGAAAFLGAGTCAFAGGQLLLLKPGSSGGGSGSGGVSELWAVDLTLPEERQAKAAAAKVVQQLTLECEEVGASSVRLAWRAPANNADKLTGYKLMATDSRGLAREAYQGAQRSVTVQGLPPGAQLIFCIKALYDDGSGIWSEPLLVTTGKREAAAAR